MRVAAWRIGSPMRARTTDARTCCAHVRARVGAGLGAHATASNRASPSRRRGPRAAPARRHSSRRRRSTRTSARGTPRRSPRLPRYAPLPARRRATAGVPDALGRAFDAARPVVRDGTADARACAHVEALACARPWCRHDCAEERFDIYEIRYIYIFYTYICIY